MREFMRTLTFFLFLTAVPNTFGQQVIIVHPLKQSSSLWNPANPNRDWLDYNGKSGRQRESEAVLQWVVTPLRGRFFPLNIPPTSRGPVVIVNPYADLRELTKRVP